MTESNPADNVEPIRLAPHTSRLLAAFVDYLLLLILVPLVAYQFNHELLRFLATLLVGGSYYGIGNSEIMRGQTLGKKVFGLQVIDIESAKTLQFSRSILRFLLSFGLIITLAELPSIIYRKLGFSSSVYLIEAHLGLALLYTTLSLFSFLLLNRRSALHDLFCKTLVLRASNDCSKQALAELLAKTPTKRSRQLVALALGILLASLLFIGGFSSDKEINQIKGAKYYLEQGLPIKIAYAVKEKGSLAIYISVEKEDLLNKEEDNRGFGDQIVQKLRSKNLLSAKKIKFYFLWAKDREQKEPEVVELARAT